MKKISLLSLLLFLSLFAVAQEEVETEEPKEGPILSFTEVAFDFGDIHQGDKVQHTFTFENTGTEALVITNVQTTCGCTAPSWPRDPVVPGQKSEIVINFNSAGKMGKQNKVITILSNSVEPRETIKITTNVLPKKTDGNPDN